ncbi:MAG TPA: BrnT family toxin [Candidatus Binataceae bacterium]
MDEAGGVVEGEQRLYAIGNVRRVLIVVHTVREKESDAVIRIISARKATPAERKLYEEIE